MYGIFSGTPCHCELTLLKNATVSYWSASLPTSTVTAHFCVLYSTRVRGVWLYRSLIHVFFRLHFFHFNVLASSSPQYCFGSFHFAAFLSCSFPASSLFYCSCSTLLVSFLLSHLFPFIVPDSSSRSFSLALPVKVVFICISLTSSVSFHFFSPFSCAFFFLYLISPFFFFLLISSDLKFFFHSQCYFQY